MYHSIHSYRIRRLPGMSHRRVVQSGGCAAAAAAVDGDDDDDEAVDHHVGSLGTLFSG